MPKMAINEKYVANTPRGRKTFDNFDEAERYVNQHGGEVIVKAIIPSYATEKTSSSRGAFGQGMVMAPESWNPPGSAPKENLVYANKREQRDMLDKGGNKQPLAHVPARVFSIDEQEGANTVQQQMMTPEEMEMLLMLTEGQDMTEIPSFLTSDKFSPSPSGGGSTFGAGGTGQGTFSSGGATTNFNSGYQSGPAAQKTNPFNSGYQSGPAAQKTNPTTITARTDSKAALNPTGGAGQGFSLAYGGGTGAAARAQAAQAAQSAGSSGGQQQQAAPRPQAPVQPRAPLPVPQQPENYNLRNRLPHGPRYRDSLMPFRPDTAPASNRFGPRVGAVISGSSIGGSYPPGTIGNIIAGRTSFGPRR